LLGQFGYIGLFVVVAILFAAFVLLIPYLLRFIRVVPHNPTPTKTSTFECGMETVGPSWVQFNFRYYFYALIFVALDVMIIFLYPWAVALKNLGVSALIAVIVFILIIAVGYIYAWRNKVLEWK